jgi:hypothetical protein
MAFEISAADLPRDAISITLRCSAKLIRPILLLFERLIISGAQSRSPTDAYLSRRAASNPSSAPDRCKERRCHPILRIVRQLVHSDCQRNRSCCDLRHHSYHHTAYEKHLAEKGFHLIRPVLKLKHQEIVSFSDVHGVNLKWLYEGIGPIFKPRALG